MIIPVQIYNFYLRKDKRLKKIFLLSEIKRLIILFPQNNEQPKYLQTAIQTISRNKNKQTYFSLLFYIAVFHFFTTVFLKCNRPLICALNIFYNR